MWLGLLASRTILGERERGSIDRVELVDLTDLVEEERAGSIGASVALLLLLGAVVTDGESVSW